MTPQSFLKEQLSILASNFPSVTIKYAFDTLIDTHIIQLEPLDEYYNNNALDQAWVPISMDFDEQFYDSISFISSDSPLKIEIPEMQWNNDIKFFSPQFDFAGLMDVFFQKKYQHISFPDQIASEIINRHLEISTTNRMVCIDSQAYSDISNVRVLSHLPLLEILNNSNIPVGNTTYALAA